MYQISKVCAVLNITLKSVVHDQLDPKSIECTWNMKHTISPNIVDVTR